MKANQVVTNCVSCSALFYTPRKTIQRITNRMQCKSPSPHCVFVALCCANVDEILSRDSGGSCNPSYWEDRVFECLDDRNQSEGKKSFLLFHQHNLGIHEGSYWAFSLIKFQCPQPPCSKTTSDINLLQWFWFNFSGQYYCPFLDKFRLLHLC